MLTRLESARSRVLLESMEESRLEIILVRSLGVFFVKHYTSKRVTSESVAIEEIVWQQLGREQLALPGSM